MRNFKLWCDDKLDEFGALPNLKWEVKTANFLVEGAIRKGHWLDDFANVTKPLREDSTAAIIRAMFDGLVTFTFLVDVEIVIFLSPFLILHF